MLLLSWTEENSGAILLKKCVSAFCVYYVWDLEVWAEFTAIRVLISISHLNNPVLDPFQ